MHNNRINSDWQFCCAPLPAGYAERYRSRYCRNFGRLFFNPEGEVGMATVPSRDQVEIRTFKPADLAEALRLKEQAGWNQTEADWQRLLDLGPEGCFVACLNGKLIGTITTIIYGRSLGWIGMMLVHPRYRRQGIGRGLMQAAIDYFHKTGVLSIKLYATPAGRPLYESLCFRVEGRIERWEGMAAGGAKKEKLRIDHETRSGIVELDLKAFGLGREALLNRLIRDCPVTPVLAHSSGGSMKGYILARPGSRAYFIGPIVAGNKEVALSLLDEMLVQLAGENVFLDLNTGFGVGRQRLLERGLVKQRDLTQMALGPEMKGGASNLIFGTAGPELG
jgi:GNAT superfamily N-acetyltransferase